MVFIVAIAGRKRLRGVIPSIAVGLASCPPSLYIVAGGVSVVRFGGVIVRCYLSPTLSTGNHIGRFLLLSVVSRERFYFFCYCTDHYVMYRFRRSPHVPSCIYSHSTSFLYRAIVVEKALKMRFSIRLCTFQNSFLTWDTSHFFS